jgi:uncharacterized protein (UPF0335 family)
MSKEIEIVSNQELKKILVDVTHELEKIQNETRHINERKKELKEYAKKKGINVKALEEALKLTKISRQEREQESYQVELYLSILEK